MWQETVRSAPLFLLQQPLSLDIVIIIILPISLFYVKHPSRVTRMLVCVHNVDFHGHRFLLKSLYSTAIEDELEVLYDAYYEELEQYTNNNQNSSGINPLTGTPVSDMDDDDEEEEEEEDPDYESDYDDDIDNPSDEDDEYSSDHLAFGNSLTVKGKVIPFIYARHNQHSHNTRHRWNPYSGR